jgi:hypothetical protein
MKRILTFALSLLWMLTLGPALAADATYGPKIYKKSGGDELIVASGGAIDVESGGSFKLAGTAVTASAAELNALASTGLSAAELAFLNGVTAGTATASKALVLDSSKGISTITSATITTLTAPTIAGGTDFTGRVTTTDGVASGTARVVGGRATANVSSTDTVTAADSNNSFVAFASAYSIPANTLKAGTVLRAKALVVVNDASGTDTLTVEMRIGGTTLVATSAVNPGATTDAHVLDFELVSRAVPGAAVSLVGTGTWLTDTGGTIATAPALLAPTNFATNGALTLDVRAKWSSNTASTSARLEMLNVEII